MGGVASACRAVACRAPIVARRRHAGTKAAIMVACCLAVAACSSAGAGRGGAGPDDDGTARPGAAPTHASTPAHASDAASEATPGFASETPGREANPASPHRPVGLVLPGSAGPAPVVPVGLAGGDEQWGVRLPGALDGELATVPNGDQVGWYSGGPVPGEPGSAVLAGHVDWGHAPAVFAGLADLVPGAAVTVIRADGAELEFGVDRVDVYPKSALPAEVLYRPAPLPELRLVTCTGPMEGGVHRDNLVVSLSMRT
jgi:hypothetical protein